MNVRRYQVIGLDCAEEIAALRQTVGRLPGVERLDFNLLHGTMTLTAGGEAPGEDLVHDAVRRAGLRATPVEASGAASGAATHRPRAPGERAGRLRTVIGGTWIAAGLLAQLAGAGGDTAGWLTRLCYGAATLLAGWGILPKAWAAARRWRPDMNLLMTIAVVGALAIGEWLEAATVTFLFAISLQLEGWSVDRARRAIRALLDVAPATARCRVAGTDTVEDRPVEGIALGTVLLVRPGERLPLDGVITRGVTAVNQAPITGESIPVSRQPGDEVWAGTINESGAIELRVTRRASDSTLSRIIRMVEEAQSRRARAEQWVERFARLYTPLMLLAAILLALLPPLIMGGGWGRWLYEALVLLVIACPCALVISTPVSIVAALSAAASAGVLVKGGVFLETAARIRVVALDKTGTLTHGHPAVQRIIPLHGSSEDEVLEVAAALEQHSGHPLARAILQAAAQRGRHPPAAESFTLVQGLGAEGRVRGRPCWVGSHRMLHERGLERAAVHRQLEAFEDAGHSVVVVGNETQVCGLIAVADTIRPGAAAVVQELRAAGIGRIALLTGDNRGTAQAVAQAVGIEDVRAELLPADKLRAVEELVRTAGPTAMIGDGINDAPALAAATLGIAMGTAGSEAAIETADIALMADDLSRVPWLMRHARRTLRIIRQNIVFALAVKAVFLILTLLDHGTLWMAIAADMGASLLVIFNALRLLRRGG